jgi:hypothetical protein
VLLFNSVCLNYSCEDMFTGGLADVAGSLPKALAKRGHRVMVVLWLFLIAFALWPVFAASYRCGHWIKRIYLV